MWENGIPWVKNGTYSNWATTSSCYLNSALTCRIRWFIWHCSQRMGHISKLKLDFWFWNLARTWDLMVLQLLAVTKWDFFLLCIEAVWVRVLVGLTWLGKKLHCLQQYLHLQCLVLVMLRIVIWLHLELVTECYIGGRLSEKIFMTDVFFFFFFFLMVDDHDCMKKPLDIYCISQTIFSNWSNSGFVLCDEKVYFIFIAFMLKM